MVIAGIVAAEWACYKLADQGLANLLGLETLRHGTNLINYACIKIIGGLPSQGHKTTGSTQGWNGDDTSKKFYVFKDSNYDGEWFSLDLLEMIGTLPMIGNRIVPNRHKYISGYNAILSYLCLPLPQSHYWKITHLFLRLVGNLGGALTVCVTPTLKFRVTPQEISAKFVDDPSYGGLAYYTTHYLGMWKIGLLGTLTQGVNCGVFKRIYNHPCKALTGVMQIASALGLAALGLSLCPAAYSVAAPIAIGLILIN